MIESTNQSKRKSLIQLPFFVKVEPRMTVPRWLPLATSIGSVVLSLVLGGFVLAYVGGDPINAYLHMFDAAFGNPGVLSDTTGQSGTVNPDRAGLHDCVPHAAVEHRCGRAILSRRVRRHVHRAASVRQNHVALDFHSDDDGGRDYRRRGCGVRFRAS